MCTPLRDELPFGLEGEEPRSVPAVDALCPGSNRKQVRGGGRLCKRLQGHDGLVEQDPDAAFEVLVGHDPGGPTSATEKD